MRLHPKAISMQHVDEALYAKFCVIAAIEQKKKYELFNDALRLLVERYETENGMSLVKPGSSA